MTSLDEYVGRLPVKTRLIRMDKREGLIRARLRGAKEAIGQVLVFFDAHVEVTKGWLPPLLNEISEDRTRVVLPVIDVISDQTLEYRPENNPGGRGGLTWKLRHSWIKPQPGITTEPFATPTMIGCAFAIDKDYFFQTGSYDDQMLIWGGENVEMSVRIWTCGGSLVVAPCSRVGHLYRKTTPHTIPGSLTEKRERPTINTARFAEVWLDSYKDFYYSMNIDAKNVEIGDVSARQELRRDLKCHDFKWFLNYVYPDAPFPTGSNFFGQVKCPLNNRQVLRESWSRTPLRIGFLFKWTIFL